MRNREGPIGRIIEDTRRFAPIAFIAGSSILSGCGAGFVPKDAAEKWGWKYEEREINYRESMRYRTVVNEEINPRNNWLILNHMMHYLLEKKAKGQFDSQAQEFLEQLQPLHFMDDSSEVAQIYEKAFISENVLDTVNVTKNDFIYEHLAKDVLPQLLSLGGFEQVMGLNEWGKTIVKNGPFKDITFGLNSVEGVSISSGLTYKAEEHPRTQELRVVYVGIGASDNLRGPKDPLGEGGSGFSPRVDEKTIELTECTLLRMAEENRLYIPTDYNPFEPSSIRQVGLVKLPCPKNGYWTNAGSSFYDSEWDGNRIVIDLSANVGEFVNSKGRAEFDIEYVVTGLNGYRIPLVQETVNVCDSVGKIGGFTKRVISRPFPKCDSCIVRVTLTNGQKTLVHNSLITLSYGVSPLEIICQENSQIPSSGIPFFHIGDVEAGQKYKVFFPLEGLSKKPGDSLYEGLANVLLLPPNDSRETSVSIGDIAVLGKDHIPGEKSHLTQSQILASYNGKCFRTIILSSRYPRAYFLSEIEIPKGTSRGDQTLAIEFYKYVDKESVEKIGEAYRAIQIR